MDTGEASESRIEITEIVEGEKKKVSGEEAEKMDVQQIGEEQTAPKENEPAEPLTKSFTTSEEDDEDGFEKNDSLNDSNTYIAWKPDVAQQPVSTLRFWMFINDLLD